MRVSPRCHAVVGLAAPPPWTVNAGIVAGDRRTLVVDTGSGAAAAATIAGYAEAVRPGNALVAVVTEPHLDHLCGVPALRARGIDVWGHAGVARRAEELEAEIAALAALVPDAVRRGRGEARLFFGDAGVAPPSVPIDGDRELELGGVTARLLLTPGHTPANLVVHVPEERVVLTGDTVVVGYLPNLECGGPREWESWLSSLDRVAALRAEALVPGHGAVVAGARPVAEAIDAVRRVLDEALRTGRAPTG